MGETNVFNGVFPKWSRIFIEFRYFRGSAKSRKHELGFLTLDLDLD